MRDVTTASGFSCRIDEAKFNDMELFEDLVALEGGQMRRLPSAVGKIMGEDKKRLYDHLRGPEGVVPMDAVLRELLEIVRLAGAKNS